MEWQTHAWGACTGDVLVRVQSATPFLQKKIKFYGMVELADDAGKIVVVIPYRFDPIAGTSCHTIYYHNENMEVWDEKTGLYNIVLILVFIFHLSTLIAIRPQRKSKEVTSMRAALKPGDNIVTIGGIVGKIVRSKDDSYQKLVRARLKWRLLICCR